MIYRLMRYTLRVARQLFELRDKTEYQMSLIYGILGAQDTEIKELRERLSFLGSLTIGPQESRPGGWAEIDYSVLHDYLTQNGWKDVPTCRCRCKYVHKKKEV